MTAQRSRPEMPSDVASEELGFFDRFAGASARFASRAPFFAFCVLLVVLWLVQGAVTMVVTGDPGTFLEAKFQLEINTTTTIVTFLMVALLQNSQTRGDQAVQHKLNAIADGLADLMERMAERFEDDALRTELHHDVRELELAVGLEDRESTAARKSGVEGRGGEGEQQPGAPSARRGAG